jgi:hypothetical protein
MQLSNLLEIEQLRKFFSTVVQAINRIYQDYPISATVKDENTDLNFYIVDLSYTTSQYIHFRNSNLGGVLEYTFNAAWPNNYNIKTELVIPKSIEYIAMNLQETTSLNNPLLHSFLHMLREKTFLLNVEAKHIMLCMPSVKYQPDNYQVTFAVKNDINLIFIPSEENATIGRILCITNPICSNINYKEVTLHIPTTIESLSFVYEQAASPEFNNDFLTQFNDLPNTASTVDTTTTLNTDDPDSSSIKVKLYEI